MTEKERMRSGALYLASDTELRADHQRCLDLLHYYNQTPWDKPEQRESLLRALLGGMGEGVIIEPPFRCDYGRNLYLGDRVYINYDLIVLDVCPVTVGNDVLIGPRVSLLAASHPVDPEVRATGLECGGPITIGHRVWLGGGVIVNPGVIIGDNSIIGSGAVVTKDIPAGVVAAGNPCRVLRPIGEADRALWARRQWEHDQA